MPLPYATMIHDMGVSERWCCVVGPPIEVSASAIFLGHQSIFEGARYRPEQGSTICMLSRDGRAHRILHDAPFNVAHVVRAFDDGDDFVLDYTAAPPWDELAPDLENYRESAFGSLARQQVRRLRVDTRTGRLRNEVVLDVPMDFPVIDGRQRTRRARWAYLAGNTRPAMPGLFRAVTRLDL